jgi:hypothetical protein
MQYVITKTQPTGAEKNRNVYLNIKLGYTYAVTKNIGLSISFNASYGLLQTYSSSIRILGVNRDNHALAYGIYGQKMLYSNIGVRYKFY